MIINDIYTTQLSLFWLGIKGYICIMGGQINPHIATNVGTGIGSIVAWWDSVAANLPLFRERIDMFVQTLLFLSSCVASFTPPPQLFSVFMLSHDLAKPRKKQGTDATTQAERKWIAVWSYFTPVNKNISFSYMKVHKLLILIRIIGNGYTGLVFTWY